MDVRQRSKPITITTTITTTTTTTTTIAIAVFLAALMSFPAGLASAGPNPPGNNGTVKIDGTPFDDAPNNEPHVGCSFQVDFYGYDEGDLDATVTFEAHPPTGPVQVLLTDTVFIGEDDNSGGGSEAGLDASETYTLDFDGIQPHPNQGFHVKLTINAEGSQGADVKHKVFWVRGCETSGTTTTTTSGATTTSSAASTSGKTSTSGSVTTTSGAPSTNQEDTSNSAVGGASSSGPGGSSGGELPFTGANAMALLIAGLALLGLGVASLLRNSRGSQA
jgi:hypothetical protein